MQTKKLFSLLLVMILSTLPGFAQDQIEMADLMRSNGKIYVVVAVAATVMTGLIIYLISIDRKVSSIEKKLKK
ncbi:MAG: CcmD family protein [Bacteroidia bacterium]|nr:CcmD family protein [Bacteroidota bacterium]MBP9084205.1 CcmD family protein [Bacteroidia bacterium]MBK7388001.1 CcmD family protein [Bacteroidota bacterium]MBK7969070.1 CcmD family protein [Bacteroidota bacterium]MBK8876763.1 CcmD family protein [Bacteroidota bacterium]